MRTLKQIVGEWEQEKMVSLGTVQHALRGRAMKPATTYQIAKAFGGSEEEAKALADAAASPQAEEKEKTSA